MLSSLLRDDDRLQEERNNALIARERLMNSGFTSISNNDSYKLSKSRHNIFSSDSNYLTASKFVFGFELYLFRT